MDKGAAELLARVLFAETKDLEDARAIAWVVKNRALRPKRFGRSIHDVIFAPKQFSGVGTEEWGKAERGRFTGVEADIYNHMLNISRGVLSGRIADPTGGADHYVNLDLARPLWADKMEKKVKIGEHTYFKER